MLLSKIHTIEQESDEVLHNLREEKRTGEITQEEYNKRKNELINSYMARINALLDNL